MASEEITIFTEEEERAWEKEKIENPEKKAFIDSLIMKADQSRDLNEALSDPETRAWYEKEMKEAARTRQQQVEGRYYGD